MKTLNFRLTVEERVKINSKHHIRGQLDMDRGRWLMMDDIQVTTITKTVIHC